MNLIFHDEAWQIWLTNRKNRKLCFSPSDAAKEWVESLPANERSPEINKAIEIYLKSLTT